MWSVMRELAEGAGEHEQGVWRFKNLNAEISAYVTPPRKHTTVVGILFGAVVAAGHTLSVRKHSSSLHKAKK